MPTNTRTTSVSSAPGPRSGRIAAALLIAAAAAPAAAQDERRLEGILRRADPSYRLRVDPTLTLSERAAFDAGGYYSFTFLHLNDENDNARTLLQNEATLFARATIDGAHSFFVRSRFRNRQFSEGDSFDSRGDGWQEPFLDRYWYQFDLGPAMTEPGEPPPDWNLSVRAGRQFVDWGAGLVLSENLYAVRPVLTLPGRWRVDGLIGITPSDESVIDFDASRDEYNRDTRRGFFGAMLSYTTKENLELYAFGMRMEDFNTDTAARLPIGIPVDFNYDAWYVGGGFRGSIGSRWLYLGEFVYELGEAASDPLRSVQTHEDISALAARGELTYVFRDENLSRAQLEMLFASGDDDRLTATDTVGGNLAGTDDTGFNSLGFANTGLAFAPSLSNLWSTRIGASTFPLVGSDWFEQLQIGGDVFIFAKLDADAPIDEPTSADAFLGTEIDAYINWRITSDFAIGVRYGVFFAGDAITANRQPRHFVLFGATLSF